MKRKLEIRPKVVSKCREFENILDNVDIGTYQAEISMVGVGSCRKVDLP